MPSNWYGSGKDTLYGGAGIIRPRDSGGRFQGTSGVEITNFESMSAKVGDWGGARIEAMRQNAEILAADIEEYMKDNAPWEDRTGDARESLQTQVVHDLKTVKIYLGYGPEIFYAFFLEHYTYGGVSYAIIRPTMERYASEALEAVAS